MKTLIILPIIFILELGTIWCQCTHQVLNLSGTTSVNGSLVTVTSAGIVDTNSQYCTATFPYFVGYDISSNMDGNGSYSFNFSPPISAATLNFSGLSNEFDDIEEIKLFVNGAHYQIPIAGTPNGCDSLAVLTPLGDIAACLGCPASGWNGTTIIGPIYSLTIQDTVISGSPSGAIFSLFICDIISEVVEVNDISSNHQLFPNPFFTEAILKTNKFLNEASLLLYNLSGEKVKQIENISGKTVSILRDNLPSGLYFLHLTENNKTIMIDRVIIGD